MFHFFFLRNWGRSRDKWIKQDRISILSSPFVSSSRKKMIIEYMGQARLSSSSSCVSSLETEWSRGTCTKQDSASFHFSFISFPETQHNISHGYMHQARQYLPLLLPFHKQKNTCTKQDYASFSHFFFRNIEWVYGPCKAVSVLTSPFS